MKLFFKSILCVSLSLFFIACSDDDNEDIRTLEIKFDNIVGKKDMNLSDRGSLDYSYVTENGQNFNISRFGYYITNIVLEGPDGERFEDEVSITAADTKGVYHVLEENPSSSSITLQNVPAGKYNKVSFTIGIPEAGVNEGAAGGVLDPAEGAWFWNWNAGYIGFAIEGQADTSSQAESEQGGLVIPEKSFAIHIGGWRDIEPVEDNPQVFVNNVRTMDLSFDSEVSVANNLQPSVHILVNAMALLDSSGVDFSTDFAIHAPSLGEPFADVLKDVFVYSHVHQ